MSGLDHVHQWQWIWGGIAPDRLSSIEGPAAIRACECGEAGVVYLWEHRTPTQQKNDDANRAKDEARRAKSREYARKRKDAEAKAHGVVGKLAR